jgi:SAM-dependent methyltransferase
MDWKNETTQSLRFQIISKYIKFGECPSILDVGCGNSEFYNFCKKENFDYNYLGVDINELMVNESNKQYGQGTARLINDIDELNTDKLLFDYVICSGTFNAKLNNSKEEWEVFFYDNLQKMFDLTNKSLIFNCMTPTVDFEYDRLYYPSLDSLSKFIASNLTRNFIIDHSYDLYEMTVEIKK